jgi:hypothetical protein
MRRYGIALDPTGTRSKVADGLRCFRCHLSDKGLKKAAHQILAAWSKKDSDKRMAQSVLTAPWDLLKFERQFDTFRRDKIQEHPVLVGDMPPLTSNRAASSFSGLSGGRPNCRI